MPYSEVCRERILQCGHGNIAESFKDEFMAKYYSLTKSFYVTLLSKLIFWLVIGERVDRRRIHKILAYINKIELVQLPNRL